MNSILLAQATTTGVPIFKWLYWLFGKCMEFLLQNLGNKYFIAIIIFTVITRLILLPLNVKQQKTMARTTRIQPKIQKIQKKYAYNGSDPNERRRMQAKMNEEIQALYAREGHNPMQVGCGPMAFQMVFLMGIIGIIYYPISYIMGVSAFGDNTESILNVVLPIYQSIVGDDGAKITYLQLNIIEHFDAYREALQSSVPAVFTNDVCAQIETFKNSLNLFGLDMTVVPHWKDGIIVIIPVICLVTSLLSSLVSFLIQKKTNSASSQQMGNMMMMLFMMPFFSFYIAFRVPAAVGFYWIISNLVAVLQQIFIAKQFPPKKTQARLMVDNTIERRSREENIKKTK